MDGACTIKESCEELISDVQHISGLCGVELLQKPQSVHRAHSLVNEQSVIKFPQVESTSCQQPVLLPHT